MRRFVLLHNDYMTYECLGILYRTTILCRLPLTLNSIMYRSGSSSSYRFECYLGSSEYVNLYVRFDGVFDFWLLRNSVKDRNFKFYFSSRVCVYSYTTNRLKFGNTQLLKLDIVLSNLIPGVHFRVDGEKT